MDSLVQDLVFPNRIEEINKEDTPNTVTLNSVISKKN